MSVEFDKRAEERALLDMARSGPPLLKPRKTCLRNPVSRRELSTAELHRCMCGWNYMLVILELLVGVWNDLLVILGLLVSDLGITCLWLECLVSDLGIICC